MDGTLDEVRDLLDQAVQREKAVLAAEEGEDARFRGLQMEALPSDTAGAVSELANHDWRSEDARQTFEP